MGPWVKAFWENESGAVTVDWVVLTASVVALCLAIFVTLNGGMDDASANLSSNMSTGNFW